MNDNHRGIIADIVVAQLSLISPNVRFLLISAMVSNPEELADWLNSIHTLPTHPIPLALKWRPSRTLRGLLVVDSGSLEVNYNEAQQRLHQLPVHRVNQAFYAPLALIAGLSGPWTLDGPPDFRITGLPISFPAVASRRVDQAQFEKWKNTSSRLLAEMFARFNIPTICFILTSRHHTFSCAEKVTDELPNCIGQRNPFPSIVEAWLSIADAELGMESALRPLLKKGIAVHSSAMLPTEQFASEWMFSQKKASLVFATGTLAQGLNLPATAVVIAGTSMGDQRKQNSENDAGVDRVNAMILNGFGRAGRPGFSNQGIAVLVSDDPFKAPVVNGINPNLALERYGVLGAPDAAVDVHSPVERFIDHIFLADNSLMEATYEELTLTSLLAEYEGDENNSGQILLRSLGGYRKRRFLDETTIGYVRARINTIRNEFLEQPNTPEWVNKVAMRSGVDFFTALRIWQGYTTRGILQIRDTFDFNVIDWLNVFFDVMALLPPAQIIPILPGPDVKRDMTLTKLRRKIRGMESINRIPWEIPEGWHELWQELKNAVLLFMNGSSFIEIARLLLELTPEEETNKRNEGDNPIPAIFSFIHNVLDRLAIDAGCFSAMQEFIFAQQNQQNEDNRLPEALQALPLCIKNGCDNLGTLSWYRFGYRERICAHILERVFPVPGELINDSERADWVKQTRQDWLSMRLTPEPQPILAHIRTVLIETQTN